MYPASVPTRVASRKAARARYVTSASSTVCSARSQRMRASQRCSRGAGAKPLRNTSGCNQQRLKQELRATCRAWGPVHVCQRGDNVSLDTPSPMQSGHEGADSRGVVWLAGVMDSLSLLRAPIIMSIITVLAFWLPEQVREVYRVLVQQPAAVEAGLQRWQWILA